MATALSVGLGSIAIDLLVVTALTEEAQVVSATLDSVAERRGDEQGGCSIYDYSRGSVRLSVATASAHEQGAVSMAVFTARLLERVRPTTACLVGIAAAVDTAALGLGDVPFAREIVSYDDVAVQGAQLDFRTKGYQTDPQMRRSVGAIRTTTESYAAWQKECHENILKIVGELNRLRRAPILLPGEELAGPHLIDGVLAGGPFLLRDREFRDRLRRRKDRGSGIDVYAPVHAKLVSVEMESHGFMCAALEHHVPATVIKGVCDVGDDEKAELEKQSGGFYRAYACSNALLAALHCAVRCARFVPGSNRASSPQSVAFDSPGRRRRKIVASPAFTLLAAQFDNLARTYSDSVAGDLERLLEQAREGEFHAVLASARRIRWNGEQWQLLELETKARLLCLEAGLVLQTSEDTEEAATLVGMSEELGAHPSQLRLRAAIADHRGNPGEAAEVLEGASDLESLNALASYLLAAGDTRKCSEVLKVCEGMEGSGWAEARRLAALLAVVQGDIGRAREALELARGRAARWLAVRVTGIVVDYFSALAPAAWAGSTPEVPLPVHWSLVRQDLESREHLARAQEEARAIVDDESLAEGVRRHVEAWLLASLAVDMARQEDAAQLAGEILVREPGHQLAIAWSIARGYSFDSEVAVGALEQDVEGGAGIANVTNLVHLLFFAREFERALVVLREHREAFDAEERSDLAAYWEARLLLAMGDASILERLYDDAVAGLEVEQRASLLHPRASDGEQEWNRYLAWLGKAYDDFQDPNLLIGLCQGFAARQRWESVQPHVDSLIYIGTAECLLIAAHALHETGQYDACVSLLEAHRGAFGAELPEGVQRLQVAALSSLGRLGDAQTLARGLVDEAPTIEHYNLLAQVLLAGGDLTSLLVVGRSVVALENLEARDAVQWAQVVSREDEDLARALLRRAEIGQVPDDYVGAAVVLGLTLGMDPEWQRPASERLQELGAQGRGGIRVGGGLPALADELGQRRQRAAEAEHSYRAGHVAIHALAGTQSAFLAEVFHSLLDRNREASDPRHRLPLFVRHGGRPTAAVPAEDARRWRIRLDITGLLLAHHLNILDIVADTFGAIGIPNFTVTFLAHMRTDVASGAEGVRIRAVRETLKAVRSGKLHVVQLTPLEAPAELVSELGAATAQAVAFAVEQSGHLVCYPPLRKPGLTREEAVVPEFAADRLTTLRGVVDALANFRAITRARHASAVARLGTAGAQAGVLPDAATSLLFDGATQQQLAEADVLAETCRTFKCYISASRREALEREVETSERAVDVAEWVRNLIVWLRDALKAGRCRPLPNRERPGAYEDLTGSALDWVRSVALESQDKDDFVWIDDRYMSAFPNVEGGGVVGGVYEIIAGLRAVEAIDSERFFDLLRVLRESDVRYLPISAEEIVFHLSAAPVDESGLAVTPGLDALRRYVATCLCSLQDLQLPAAGQVGQPLEAPFLLSLRDALIQALRDLWLETGPQEYVTTRSEWIVRALLPVLPVMTMLPAEPSEASEEHARVALAESLLRLLVVGMLLPTDQRGVDYLRWLDSRILSPNVEREPALARLLGAGVGRFAGGLIAEAAKGSQAEQRGRLAALAPRLAALPPWLQSSVPEERMRDLGVERFVDIGGLQARERSFWPAVTAAIDSGSGVLSIAESEEPAEVARCETHASCLVVKHPKRRSPIHLVQETLEIASRDAGRRGEGLNACRHIFDRAAAETDALIAGLEAIDDVTERMQAVEARRADSAEEYYQRLVSVVSGAQTICLETFRPPSVASLLRHLRWPAQSAEVGFREIVDRGARDLVAELGAVEALRRLAGLPCALPPSLVAAFDGDVSAQLEAFGSGSVLRRAHWSFLQRRLKAGAWALQLGVGWLLDLQPSDLEVRALSSVLRVVDTAFRTWSELRSLTADLRLALTWVHAHRVYEQIVGAGVSLEALESTLSGLVSLRRWGDLRFELLDVRDVASVSSLDGRRFLTGCLGYALGDWRVAVPWANFGRVRDSALTIVAEDGVPALELWRDVALAPNALDSFLGASSRQFLCAAFEKEFESLAPQQVCDWIVGLGEKLVDGATPEETARSWMQVGVLVGDAAPYAEAVEAVREGLEHCDFGVLCLSTPLGIRAFSAAAQQLVYLVESESLAGRFREQIDWVAERLDDAEMCDGVDRRELAVGIVQVAFFVGRLASTGETAATEIAGALRRIANQSSFARPYCTSLVDDFSEQLPIGQAKAFWQSAIEARQL